jgi:hypothetical protein
MAQKYIMTTNGSIAHKTGSTVSSGSFLILAPPAIPARQDSLNVQIEGDNVYRAPLKYSFANGNAVGFDPGTVYTKTIQNIPATATNTRVDGDLVMRVDDSATMVCYGITAGGGPEAAVAGALVEVDSAGQDKVTGD